MTLQVDLWQLLSALAGAAMVWVGAVWGIAKIAMRQHSTGLDHRFTAHEALEDEKFASITAGLDARFDTIERAREEGQARWQAMLDAHMAATRQRDEAISRLERDFLQFLARLPIDYVRKEDHVRSETVTGAKLDALAAKIDLYHREMGGAKL